MILTEEQIEMYNDCIFLNEGLFDKNTTKNYLDVIDRSKDIIKLHEILKTRISSIEKLKNIKIYSSTIDSSLNLDNRNDMICGFNIGMTNNKIECIKDIANVISTVGKLIGNGNSAAGPYYLFSIDLSDTILILYLATNDGKKNGFGLTTIYYWNRSCNFSKKDSLKFLDFKLLNNCEGHGYLFYKDRLELTCNGKENLNNVMSILNTIITNKANYKIKKKTLLNQRFKLSLYIK